MDAAVVSDQGHRFHMEDTHFLDLDFGGQGWIFGGVYDGHGGSFASEYASQKLHRVFLQKLSIGLSPKDAFIGSYETISDDLASQESGTTAVNFLIKEGHIFAANAGDARAIVIGAKEFHQLTVDHRLDNPAERQRIENMGGVISYPYACRGDRGLMPTRAIGDEYFKPIGIIAKPWVSQYEISESDLVLLAASDGLFDVMTNEEAAEFARKTPEPKRLLQVLKTEVLFNRFGTDNLTMIAVSLG